MNVHSVWLVCFYTAFCLYVCIFYLCATILVNKDVYNIRSLLQWASERGSNVDTTSVCRQLIALAMTTKLNQEQILINNMHKTQKSCSNINKIALISKRCKTKIKTKPSIHSKMHIGLQTIEKTTKTLKKTKNCMPAYALNKRRLSLKYKFYMFYKTNNAQWKAHASVSDINIVKQLYNIAILAVYVTTRILSFLFTKQVENRTKNNNKKQLT